MPSYNYPVFGGGGGGLTKYSTFSAFSPGTAVGDVAIAQDTLQIYSWNGSAWVVNTGVSDGNIQTSVAETQAATNANTASTIIKRDASGNFSAGTITASLSGNASTATSATSFTGSLSGDVTGTQSATAIASTVVTGKLITGFVSGAGTVAATDTVLQAINKLDGNVAGKEPTITTLAASKGGLGTDASAFTGVVKASSGVFSASSLVNADVSNTAAIAYSKLALSNSIVNADISSSAAIVDTKLATISTAGKVSNSATTATNANTASAIVARDASGNFSAGTITAALSGNATTATTATNFSGSLSGDVTGTQGATAISSTVVTGKLLTGYVSGAGTVAGTDTVLQGIQKLNGNIGLLQSCNALVSVSGNVTLTNKALHLVSTAAARSLTLPSPTSGAVIMIKDSTGSCATNNITLVRAGSEKIETVAASYVLDTDLGAWMLVSDGTDWWIV